MQVECQTIEAKNSVKHKAMTPHVYDCNQQIPKRREESNYQRKN